VFLGGFVSPEKLRERGESVATHPSSLTTFLIRVESPERAACVSEDATRSLSRSSFQSILASSGPLTNEGIVRLKAFLRLVPISLDDEGRDDADRDA
jgi:hypothetical protein